MFVPFPPTTLLNERLSHTTVYHVARYPTLMFQSTRVDALGDRRYLVRGDVTIRDRTRPIVLEVVTTSPVEDAKGGQRAGARAEAQISRTEWGIDWNYPLPSGGGLLVGDTVWFTIDVEAVASMSSTAR